MGYNHSLVKQNLAGNIGERIRLYRERRLNISQEELSERSNVHVTHISRLENGVRLPNLQTLFKICSGLNAPISEILKMKPMARASYDTVTTEIWKIVMERSKSERKTILKLLKSYYSGNSKSFRRIQ